FSPSLARKPQIVAANKIDLPEGRTRLASFRAAVEARGFAVFPVSAATGEGVEALVQAVRETLSRLPRHEPAVGQRVAAVRRWDPVRVTREGDGFRVDGEAARQAAAVVDPSAPEAIAYVERRLRRLGVFRLLAEAGAKPGDRVWVADVELVFRPDTSGPTR
ncbi:MAG: Obg family GTPase CgtA, partial [Clostridia bacterium]|nr:Obg family GTPase CgtA [Clostridia bacterium]